MFKGHNIWLFKPSDNNRGQGIKLFNNMSTFNSVIISFNYIDFK